MTLMQQETLEIAEVIARQYAHNTEKMIALAKKIKEKNPRCIATLARGSSDHAASFLHYVFGKELGFICASLPPSLVSIYDSHFNAKDALVIAISQSGESPDICKSVQRLKEDGALTIAIVNQENSTLAAIADDVITLCAGTENSVAATKTYMASLFAILHLLQALKPHPDFEASLPILIKALSHPPHFEKKAIEECVNTSSLIFLARGLMYPIAQEAALKCKETCQIHAEPFSTAEFQHGPMELVRPDFPIFIFAKADETLHSVLALCEKLTKLGAKTFLMGDKKSLPDDQAIASYTLTLPAVVDDHLSPLIYIQAFYVWVAELAIAKNRNPDKPLHLQKVTRTK
jgi:glucosamine--fructose-6-phosphate aminotransferase (isomerizing)